MIDYDDVSNDNEYAGEEEEFAIDLTEEDQSPKQTPPTPTEKGKKRKLGTSEDFSELKLDGKSIEFETYEEGKKWLALNELKYRYAFVK